MMFAFVMHMAAPGTPAIPLPAKTDVPADMGGVVLCADDPTARRMYETYFVDKPGSTLINLDAFFAGLKATGCTQTSGPLTISRVDQRKKLADGSYIRFAGLTPDGKPVYGILNEDANNRFPRTDLERWLENRMQNGIINMAEYDRTVYRCPSVQSARAVVTAIPEGEKVSSNRQVKALKNTLKKQKCGKISIGKFTVKAVHESRWIIYGEEDAQEFTALTVIDENGKTVGLVFDGAMY